MEKYLFTSVLIASLLSVMNYSAPIHDSKVISPGRKPAIGDQIKLARIQNGYSQKYLARMTGLKYDDLLAIEEGEAIPTINMLYKIQETLGGAIVIDGDALARQ